MSQPNTSAVLNQGGGGLSDNYYQKQHIAVSSVLLLVPIPAITANMINIKTFISMGVHDGVSVSFLALAMSDLMYSLFSFAFTGSMVVAKLEVLHPVLFPVNPVAVVVYTYLVAVCFYPITGMSTTYLAVARCMCVVKPLQFKNVFTRSRSIAIHVFFAVFAIGSYSVIYSQTFIRPAFDPSMNVTRGLLAFTDIRDEVKDIVFIIFDTVIAFSSQLVMVLCVIVMADSLRKSQQFRQSSQVSALKGDDSSEGGGAYKLSGKELMVVKQVVLICTIYFVCSLPKMLIAILSLTNPEFALGRGLNNFYYDMHTARNVFELVNAATTIFVYYRFNSKFRATLLGKK